MIRVKTRIPMIHIQETPDDGIFEVILMVGHSKTSYFMTEEETRAFAENVIEELGEKLALFEFIKDHQSSKDFDWKNAVCHDCGAKVGELHQLGCDMERCPICGKQLITCSDHYPLVEKGGYQRIPYIQPLVYCGSCGKTYPVFFSVPDEEWDKFVIPPLQDEVVCRSCYDEMRILFPEGWRDQPSKNP